MQRSRLRKLYYNTLAKEIEVVPERAGKTSSWMTVDTTAFTEPKPKI